MGCASCSAKIEKRFTGREGVHLAKVNLATESIELDCDQCLLPEIQQELASMGFGLVIPEPVQKRTYLLSIKGMGCASCSSKIERTLRAMDEVERADVNLPLARAEIVSSLPLREIKSVIVSLGFTVESLSASGEERAQRNAEKKETLVKMQKNLLFMVLFALPLFYLSMSEMVGISLPSFVSPQNSLTTFAFLQFLLCLPVVYLGRGFYLRGVPALLRGMPNMDSLVALGTGASFCYSTYNFVLIVFGHVVHDLYFESVAVLITLIFFGKYLEARARLKTGHAIDALVALRPDKVTILVENSEVVVLVSELERGDIVIVRPGERLAVDGEIIQGTSTIDESMLTGESLPVVKDIGDKISAGTMNQDGVLRVRAEAVGEGTVLAGIIAMVEDAQGAKPAIADLADRISLYFVPIVLVIACVTFLGWYFVGGLLFGEALKFCVAVLVIACPCAMGLATPTSIIVGVGRAAQLGILIRNGEALQRAEKVDIVAFDKTGTITYGKPHVTDILPELGFSEEKIIQLCYSLEKNSEHPLAHALVREAEKRSIKALVAEAFKAHHGYGIEAQVGTQKILFGNEQLMMENGVEGTRVGEAGSFGRTASRKDVKKLSVNGKTVLFLAVDGNLAGLVAVADTPKPEVRHEIEKLAKNNIHSVMLTGDQKLTAKAIALQVGIGKVIAEILPAEKAERVKRLQQNDHKVAMVGDGINDAPALAQADIGIAMGSGTDIAIEAGDIVLVSGKIEKVGLALGLSKCVMRNIRQNLFWAFIFNIIAIPVAAGVLVPFGGPSLNPMFAGLAMALSSVTVVSNALRIRHYGKE